MMFHLLRNAKCATEEDLFVTHFTTNARNALHEREYMRHHRVGMTLGLVPSHQRHFSWNPTNKILWD